MIHQSHRNHGKEIWAINRAELIPSGFELRGYVFVDGVEAKPEPVRVECAELVQSKRLPLAASSTR